MVESSTSRYNLITDLFNEEYEREEVQQVDAELKAYQKVVDKLEAALKAGEVDIKCLEEPWICFINSTLLPSLLHLLLHKM